MITLGQLLAILVGVVGAFFGAAVWAFTHLEQIEILLSWVYRLFSWTGRRIKLKAIATQIQSRINVTS